MSIREAYIEVLEARVREQKAAAAALVDAVERYVRQECLRSELLNIKNEVKANTEVEQVPRRGVRCNARPAYTFRSW
jgi:hypothetical protein